MLRRKFLTFAIILVFVTQALVTGLVLSVYALVPPPEVSVFFHFDYDSIEGMKVVRSPPQDPGTPEFVLERGETGTFNVTLTSREKEPVFVELRYGGFPPYTRGWSPGDSVLPDGITYNIKPDKLTLAPNSSSTAMIRIASAATTDLRSYDMTVTLNINSSVANIAEGHSTFLTIVEGTSSPSTNTTKTTTSRTSYVTQTTTFTSTTTTITTIFAGGAVEPSIYAWAVGASIVAAVLAVVLFRRRS